MKTFQGRVVTPGCVKAEALVTREGFNTLASFQSPLQFGDKTAKCGDQNNADLYGKPMAGKALCLPQGGWFFIAHVPWNDSRLVCCLRTILTPWQQQEQFLRMYGLTVFPCLLWIVWEMNFWLM